MSQIYTLQSAAAGHLDELWYVGRTTNILERFNKHQRGSGARCLVGRSNIVMTRLEKEVPFLELTRTLELMASQGAVKVRGGPFVRQQHSLDDLAMIKILLESESFARPVVENASTIVSTASVSSASTEPETKNAEKRPRSESGDTLMSDLEEAVSYTRAGKPWTSEEHTAFRNLILDGVSRDVAERKMQRKHTALDAMARKLITMRMGSGHSLEDICEFLKKSPEQVQSVLSGGTFF